MKMRGEITVFLSLTIVCMLSLFMGLLESARTAGARLYLKMAANSAMDSVMSQYNRNLWDMYHLLFLESESEAAIAESFETYLNYYIEQENWYPMELRDIEVSETVMMDENGGSALEQEILSYIKYCFPEIAADLSGMSKEVAEAEKAGDFRYLFEVCEQAGKKTKKLEKSRKKVEESLEEMHSLFEKAKEAAGNEKEDKVSEHINSLIKKITDFPGLVEAYEKEAEKISEYMKELNRDSGNTMKDSRADQHLQQELQAYTQLEDASRNQLARYQEMEVTLKETGNKCSELAEFIEISEDSENGVDWEEVKGALDGLIFPEASVCGPESEEKAAAIERLEELFSGEFLALVLPDDAVISEKKVSLSGIPSEKVSKDTGLQSEQKDTDVLKKGLINEYCFLSFNSFLEKKTDDETLKLRPLIYEQEYLLCGKASDRENLKSAVEKIMLIRGAMNLMYLLSTPERKAETDSLAAAVSGGNIPVQMVMSFFIMTLWAFGEAIWDVKCLLDGGKIPFWKNQLTWKLDLDGLLSLKFLEPLTTGNQEGRSYQDYMRILFLLMDSVERNFRIMDVIQWNVRTVQNDFSAADCYGRATINAKVANRHVFAVKTEYIKSIEIQGDY